MKNDKMEKFVDMTKEDAVFLLEGMKSDFGFVSGMTDPELRAFQMAVDCLKDSQSVEKLQKEIERLKIYNRIYFQKISDYITLFDKWKSSKSNTEDHMYYQKECMEIEKWMREERDRVMSILNKKNDQQLKLDI